MKSFVFIALAIFLGTVAVQGYGPKLHRKHHGGSHKSHHGSHHKPSHGSHHEPSHGTHHRPPSRDHIGHQHGHWDNSPEWDDRSDPWDSGEDRGNSDSFGDDSYGPGDDRYGPDSDSSEHYEPSYEDYGDWYHHHNHHYSKRPCKHPSHNKKPHRTTPKPTTHHLTETQATIPPHTTRTQPTPRSIATTAAVSPHPTTTAYTPRPTRTVGPTPSTEDTTDWETTTSIPETTTTGEEEEEFTTISPEVQNCIDTCPSTPEFNPVCGTNDETYNNEGKLFCARSCGVNVSLRRRSVCPPPPFDYDDDDDDNGNEQPPPTPPPTTTTTPGVMGRTTPFSSFQRCMRQCRITPSFTPVCGTDLTTYMNMDRLKCAQSCGEVVEVLCEKPCAACGLNPVTVRTTALPPTTTNHNGRTTQESEIRECITACPVTSEYNPVCGSNYITYTNPGHLLCAQLCGVAVYIVRFSQCPPRTTTTSTTEAPAPTLSPDVLSCIRRCPVTSEYDPVCGTDDLTYTNLGNLECSRFCGVDVELKHRSRCEDEFDLGPDGIDSTTTQTAGDVNGDKDGTTTPSRSPETTTSLFTSPTTTSTTTPASTASTTASTLTTPTVPISTSTLGFTIPPDILIDIFGPTVTKPSTVGNSDEDESLDLDTRFNNDTGNVTNTSTEGNDNSKIVYPD